MAFYGIGHLSFVFAHGICCIPWQQNMLWTQEVVFISCQVLMMISLSIVWYLFIPWYHQQHPWLSVYASEDADATSVSYTSAIFVQGYYGIFRLDQSSKDSFDIFSTITADNATTSAEKSLIHIWPISEPQIYFQKHAI